MLIVLILAIVFIALYAHQISKKKTTGTTEKSKYEASTTETNTNTTAEPVSTTTTTTGGTPTIYPTTVCLSQECVIAASGQLIVFIIF